MLYNVYTIITHYIHIDTEILILAGNFRLGKQEPTIYFHGGISGNCSQKKQLMAESKTGIIFD